MASTRGLRDESVHPRTALRRSGIRRGLAYDLPSSRIVHVAARGPWRRVCLPPSTMAKKLIFGVATWLASGFASVFVPPLGGASATLIDISRVPGNVSFDGGVDARGCPIGWTCLARPGAPAAPASSVPILTAPQRLSEASPDPKTIPDKTLGAPVPTGRGGPVTATQATISTWQPANTYQFTFWVAPPNATRNQGSPDTPPTSALKVSMLAHTANDDSCGGNPCKADVSPLGLGEWEPLVIGLASTPGLAQTIGVALLDPTSAELPTINYEIAPRPRASTPEPGTLVLLTAGLSAMLFALRRDRPKRWL